MYERVNKMLWIYIYIYIYIYIILFIVMLYYEIIWLMYYASE